MDAFGKDTSISRNRANQAGKTLRAAVYDGNVNDERCSEAIEVAQVWRSQHVEATQRCFSAILAQTAGSKNYVCTYRLKRLDSIIRKLQRTNTHLKLGELDDIGGCRVIAENVAQVRHIAQILKDVIPLKNNGSEKDYIASPQQSGYRSHHLLAKINTDGGSYQVEIQLRTQLQHCWSTAVEAAGEIYGAEYKSPEIRRLLTGVDAERIVFFQIVSSLFALEEDAPQVPEFEQTYDTLINRLRSLSCTASLLDDLQASADNVFFLQPELANGDNNLFLLKFSRNDQFLDIEPFPESRLNRALERYNYYENRIGTYSFDNSASKDEDFYDNVVLVYANNFEQLEIAYPNYSTNVEKFVEKVRSYL